MPKLQPYLILSLLIFIFAGPLILAIAFYCKPPAWLTQKTLNRGILIYPSLDFKKLKKQTIFKNKIYKPWQILYLTNTKCQQSCQQRLHNLHQIILALGKHGTQVTTTLIQIDSSSTFKSAINYYTITKKEYQHFFLNKKLTTGYYIIDPAEKIILYYPLNTPGEAVYKDLMHLL